MGQEPLAQAQAGLDTPAKRVPVHLVPLEPRRVDEVPDRVPALVGDG